MRLKSCTMRSPLSPRSASIGRVFVKIGLERTRREAKVLLDCINVGDVRELEERHRGARHWRLRQDQLHHTRTKAGQWYRPRNLDAPLMQLRHQQVEYLRVG